MEAAEQVSRSFLDFMHQKPRRCSLFAAWAVSGEASSGGLSRCSSSVVVSNDGNVHNHELQGHSGSKPYESSAESEPGIKAHDYIGLAEVSSASSSVNENECVSDCEDTDLRLALGPLKDDHSMQRSLPSLDLEPKDRAIMAGQSLHRVSANLFMSTGVMPHKNGFKRAFGEALGEANPCSLMASSAFMQCKGMAQSENQQIKILPSWPASKCTSVYSSREAVKRHDESERYTSALVELPATKGQVVGWPPIRAYRRNIVLVSPNQPKENEEGHSTMYVKVNMDGIPIGRKVDLNVYSSYESLVSALEEMFYNPSNGNSAQFLSNGMFVLTYEDKEGDWMLVGDVPWGMFVNSVKRLRIVRGSEATGLGPRR